MSNNTAKAEGDRIVVTDPDGHEVGYAFKSAHGSQWVAVKYEDDDDIDETRYGAFTREGALRILGVEGYADDLSATVTCADCGAALKPSPDYESDLWKTVPDGRYFCGASDDALHHPTV